MGPLILGELAKEFFPFILISRMTFTALTATREMQHLPIQGSSQSSHEWEIYP
jgi:hypothetical protein